jgi:hypothetical protein
MKSGNLNFLEPSGPLQACNGTDLPFITFSECMFAALVILRAMRMHHIVICGLSGSAEFFHIILKTAQFSKEIY